MTDLQFYYLSEHFTEVEKVTSFTKNVIQKWNDVTVFFIIIFKIWLELWTTKYKYN